MKSNAAIATMMVIAALLTGCSSTKPERKMAMSNSVETRSFYLPNAEASRIVSVTNAGPSAMSLVIQTHRAAVKETGPKETVARFGEVYAFSPGFIAVHRDEPTQIRFWNLQPDDEHTFMLLDPQLDVLMNILLPPVQETSFVFTFHREGLFYFLCAMHPPGMTGQILVLPPQRKPGLVPEAIRQGNDR
jgi:plastocyanin